MFCVTCITIILSLWRNKMIIDILSDLHPHYEWSHWFVDRIHIVVINLLFYKLYLIWRIVIIDLKQNKTKIFIEMKYEMVFSFYLSCQMHIVLHTTSKWMVNLYVTQIQRVNVKCQYNIEWIITIFIDNVEANGMWMHFVSILKSESRIQCNLLTNFLS